VIPIVALAASGAARADCPASGAARLGRTAQELAAAAQAAIAGDEPRCVARGLALADMLERRGVAACAAADRIDQEQDASPDVDLSALRAVLDWRCGRARDAWREARAAVELDPGATLGWSVLGMVLEARFRQDAARAAYERALALDPAEATALWGMARVAPTREQRNAYLRTYLEAAPSRGEPAERLRSARDNLAFFVTPGDRPIWQLSKADLPGSLPLLPYVPRAGHLAGWIVRVKVGDEDKVPALLDSGASGLHLSPHTARKAGIEPLAGGTLVGGGGKGEHGIERGVLSVLDLGPVAFEHPVGMVAERSLHPQGLYNAILGVDLLGGTAVRFEPARKLATILRAAEPAPVEDLLDEDPWSLPAGSLPVLEVEGQLLVPVTWRGSSGSVDALALLDTGASRTFLDWDVATRLGGLQRGGQRSAAAYGGAVTVSGMMPFVRLGLGPFEEGLKEVAVFDLSERGRVAGVAVSGYVGLDVLSRHAVELDLAGGVLSPVETEPR